MIHPIRDASWALVTIWSKGLTSLAGLVIILGPGNKRTALWLPGFSGLLMGQWKSPPHLQAGQITGLGHTTAAVPVAALLYRPSPCTELTLV